MLIRDIASRSGCPKWRRGRYRRRARQSSAPLATLEIDEFSRARIDASVAELEQERDAVVDLGFAKRI
ncbi:hypothetical protein ACW2Q0_06360 [Nocardia sp. R16R-3T]